MKVETISSGIHILYNDVGDRIGKVIDEGFTVEVPYYRFSVADLERVLKLID